MKMKLRRGMWPVVHLDGDEVCDCRAERVNRWEAVWSFSPRRYILVDASYVPTFADECPERVRCLGQLYGSSGMFVFERLEWQPEK